MTDDGARHTKPLESIVKVNLRLRQVVEIDEIIVLGEKRILDILISATAKIKSADLNKLYVGYVDYIGPLSMVDDIIISNPLDVIITDKYIVYLQISKPGPPSI